MSKKIYIGDTPIRGSEGKSAYQVWLDQGNIGTEADFLASLKGDKGDTGPTAERVIPKVSALCAGRKAVACGDFNVPLRTIEDIGLGLTHARSFLGLPKEDTFANFTKPESHGEIDHFFTSSPPETFRIVRDGYGCERMSDHYPILLTF